MTPIAYELVPIQARNWAFMTEMQRLRALIPGVVPSVKLAFILLETIDKGLPIFHNILMFMTINIHSTMLAIPPSQFAEPVAGST